MLSKFILKESTLSTCAMSDLLWYLSGYAFWKYWKANVAPHQQPPYQILEIKGDASTMFNDALVEARNEETKEIETFDCRQSLLFAHYEPHDLISRLLVMKEQKQTVKFATTISGRQCFRHPFRFLSGQTKTILNATSVSNPWQSTGPTYKGKRIPIGKLRSLSLVAFVSSHLLRTSLARSSLKLDV